MFIKSVIAASLFTAAVALPAAAGNQPTPRANALSQLDNTLDRLERRGVIKQGSRLDRIEDRIDRKEDKIDRRVNKGPKDRAEDRADRRENRRDRNNKRWK